jgi:long-chain fatty acid transport protein
MTVNRIGCFQRIAVLTLGAGLLLAPHAGAGDVDNRNNFSAGFVRNLARNAANETPDAAVYNPAGLSDLSGGLHLAIADQPMIRNYSQTLADGQSFKADLFAPILPSAFAVYRHGPWTGFTYLVFPAGGGTVNYPNGSVSTLPLLLPLAAQGGYKADANLTSYYYGPTAGISYGRWNGLSASISGRYLHALRELSLETGKDLPGTTTSKAIDHAESATGVMGIFSVDWAPTPSFNLAAKFESIGKLEWTVDKSEMNIDGLFADSAKLLGTRAALRSALPEKGKKYQRDLPPVITLGSGIRLSECTKLSLGLTYYWNTIADWGGAEDDHDNGIEWSAGFDWSAIPEKLTVSTSAMYGSAGANSETYNVESPALSAISIGGGARLALHKAVDLEAGYTRTQYLDDHLNQPTLGKIDLERSNHVFGLGLNFHFLN